MPNDAVIRSLVLSLALLSLLMVLSCRAPTTTLYGELVEFGNRVVHGGLDLDPPPGVEVLLERGTFSYVIDTAEGVVVVDPGFDPEARALKALIGRRQVAAVLLTHGHLDHADAARTLNAPTYVGDGDDALLRGDLHLRCFLSHGGQHVVGNAPPPDDLRIARELVVGGRTFRPFPLPGHTPGSTAWLTRDIAFTGDAIVNPTGGALGPSPGTTEDVAGAWQSIRRLAREVPELRVILDAHYGRTDDARAMLRAAVEAHFH